MRLLTGKHRVEYETIFEQASLTMFLKGLLADVTNDRDRERARADRAVDALLAVRGFPTVTPPKEGMEDLPDTLDEDPEAVAKLEQRMARGDASVFTERS